MALAITEKAAEKAKEILAERGAGREAALRIFVTGGVAGEHRYGLAVARKTDAGDIVIEKYGARVAIDFESAELLAAAELDYLEDDRNHGFTIFYPNGLHACVSHGVPAG